MQAAIDQAAADVQAGRKSRLGPGLIAVCVTWFGLGAFQSAASISIVAFATEVLTMKQYTGFRVRLLLVQLIDWCARIWCEGLDDSIVAVLLSVLRGESRHRLVHVCQAPVGDHDHLPADRRGVRHRLG